ncbi:MAG: SRPBCC family protein [Pseudomonadota bacterium]
MTTFKTSRVFAATPEAVYAAFAAPERLARWWGPDGFRNTFETFDFKPGGLWRFTMHGPNGADYPNESTFVTLEPDRTIVLRHTNQPHFQLTIGLEATAGGTLVTWAQAFDDSDVAARVKHIVEPANEQNLDRWEAEVATGAG